MKLIFKNFLLELIILPAITLSFCGTEVLFCPIVLSADGSSSQSSSSDKLPVVEKTGKTDVSNDSFPGTFEWDSSIDVLSNKRVLTPEQEDLKQARILFITARDMEKRSGLYESLYGKRESKKSSKTANSDKDGKSPNKVVYSKYQKRLWESQALQNYQRVARLNPSATVSARIVEMACLKERYNLANRYVELMFAQNQPVSKIDPMLLRQLAAGLANLGEIKQAYRLYKPILDNTGTRFDPQSVILNFEGAKYAYLSEDYRQAADSFLYVYRAAEDPREFGLSPRLIDVLEIEKPATLRLAADAFLLDGRYDSAGRFFEMADKLDENSAILAYHKARIATAENKFSSSQTWLEEALDGDLSGEGDAPIKLMFSVSEKLNQKQHAQQRLEQLIKAIEKKLSVQESKNQQLPPISVLGKLNKKDKNAISSMDTANWNYYCQQLSDQGKTDQALKLLNRFYSAVPNMETLKLQLSLQLNSGLYEQAFDSMARVFKTTGSIGTINETIAQYTKSAEHKKRFLAAAEKQQARHNKQTSDSGLNISSGWSIYHAAAVGLALLDSFEGKPLSDQMLDPNNMTEKPESAEITQIRPFMDYALKLAPAGRIVPEKISSPLLKSALSKVQSYLEVKDNAAKSPFNGPSVSLLWGIALLRDSQYKSAAQVWRRGLELCNNIGQQDSFGFYLSGALVLLKQNEQAMAQIEKCLADSPNDIDFLSRKAWLLYLDNKIEDSQELYLQILDKFNDKYTDESLRNSLRDVRATLATIYDKQAADPKISQQKRDELLSKSEELLEQILDEYPNDTGAMNDLAYFWSERQMNLHRAEKMALNVVEQSPKNAAYWDTLGWICYQRKEYQKALEHLKHSIELQEDPTMFDHLGDVYKALNNLPEAQTSWKKAAELLQDKEFQKQYPHLLGTITKKLDGG